MLARAYNGPPIDIISPAGGSPSDTGRKRAMKAPDLQPIPFEREVEAILDSEKSIEEIASEKGCTAERLQSMIDEYHRALDIRMEVDKARRKALFKSFKDLGKELRRLPWLCGYQL
jgi:hypothetical protein